MSKNEKMAMVPRLRFPEFRYSGEWEEKTLGDIGTFHKGRGISKSDIVEDGITKCIRYGQMYTIYDEVINNVYSKTNIAQEKLVLSVKNDVILPSSGETKIDIATASCILLDGIALGGDINIIRSKVNGVFLSYYLNGAKKVEIANIAQGDTVVHLYSTKLIDLTIYLPTLSEQQKIADCLSSLDDLITAENKKLGLLKDYKKGLMQKLFPAEGETVPELRFAEFRECGEWEEKKLGDVAIKKSSSISANTIEDNYGKYIVYGASGILKKIDFYEEINDYISIVKDGSGVGRLQYCTGKSSVLGTMEMLKSDKISMHFLYFSLLNIDFTKYITGSTIPHVYFKDYSKNILKIPSISEQQKIADCLSSLNALITAQAQKIEGLKLHKKGLMQGLFPSVTEVSE